MFAIMITVLLGMSGFPSGVTATKKLCVKETILPYYKLMTPEWIQNYSTITGPHSLHPQYFEILPTTGVPWQHALQVQLVPPDVLKATDSVTVTITVAMDTEIADSLDHDPSFGVSDRVSFVGYFVVDQSNYHAGSPCQLIEGEISDIGALQSMTINVNGPLVTSRQYSSEVKMQIRPTERWGSCHTEHDQGYTNIANYQRLMDLTRGLYFDMYRHDTRERYRIKYIIVTAELD